jgi:hypothetical protein
VDYSYEHFNYFVRLLNELLFFFSFSRYSYIDKDETNRDHKPVGPKIEPKKLVRYRDNKIVSLKGERYTEFSRRAGEEDAELKKPKKPICP